jgi:hypothetical protein
MSGRYFIVLFLLSFRWSAEFGGPRTGYPELHAMLGDYLYTECPELDMVRISRHFVRAEDPEKFASMLVNFMGRVSLFVSSCLIFDFLLFLSFSVE